MQSQISKNKNYTLSIAIPTWNRSQTLSKALDKIIPQVKNFKEEIQIVIADNASEDNTDEVIKTHISQNPQLHITHFLQKENTGFYGNFTKVKELSTGKFIWLLSDDDYIADGCVSKIMEVLINHVDIGFVFLNDWKWGTNKGYSTELLSIESLFRREHFRLTLISAVIFYNEKENELLLVQKYAGSNFIGLIFFIAACERKKDAFIVYGDTINVGMDQPKGYNWFQAFILDMSRVFDFMFEVGFENETIKRFKVGLYKRLILYKYSRYKANSRLEEGIATWPLRKVNKLIFEYYVDSVLSLMQFFPYYITPAYILKRYFNIKKQIKLRIMGAIGRLCK